MMNFNAIDTDAKALEAVINIQKARVLLNDLNGYFMAPGCMTPGYAPNAETLEAVREDFGTISVKLSLISDVLDTIEKNVKGTSLNLSMMTGD